MHMIYCPCDQSMAIDIIQFSSVQSLSHVWLFATPWTAAHQASLSVTHSWSLLKLISIKLVILSSHPNLCFPPLFLPPIFPSIRVFSIRSVLASGGQSIGASASASILPVNIQDWFPLGWTGLISLQSKELLTTLNSSSTPQFKSIHSLALRFLYGPTLISTHEYWKNHSFGYIQLISQRQNILQGKRDSFGKTEVSTCTYLFYLSNFFLNQERANHF